MTIHPVSRQSAFWLNGTPTAVLPLPNRAVEFGDGLFETLLLHRGEALFSNLHLERLALGLRALALPDCLATVQQHLDNVTRSIDKAPLWAALRLSVIRGAGKRGYAPEENAEPAILITVTQIERDCTRLSRAATMGVADIRLATQPLLARIKHLNRLEQVLAAAQAQAENVDECFVLDQDGRVVSVIAGNVFLVIKGELLTPALVNCGVAGTRRRLIIEKWAPAIGLEVRETQVTLSDLQVADEVFYSNSLHGVRPISRLDAHAWDDHGVCAALFQQYLDDLA